MRQENNISRMVSVKVDGVSSRTTVGDLEYLFEKYVDDCFIINSIDSSFMLI